MAAPMRKFLVQTIKPTSTKHSGSVIFFHGSGDTGDGIRGWLKAVLGEEFSFPHLDVVIPTAPLRENTSISTDGLHCWGLGFSQITPSEILVFQPYSLYGGGASHVWFDRVTLAQNVPETESVTTMCEELAPIITDLQQQGDGNNKIIIGGFSMGACLAMHLAYRFHPNVAGCFSLSGFLNDDSAVFYALKNSPSSPPQYFCCHGQSDSLVMYEWGERTASQLKSLGVSTEFHSFPRLSHDLERTEVKLLRDWINKLIPNN